MSLLSHRFLTEKLQMPFLIGKVLQHLDHLSCPLLHFSISVVSILRQSDQNCTHCSNWGHIINTYEGIAILAISFSVPSLLIPVTTFAFYTATYAAEIFLVLSTIIPRSLPVAKQFSMCVWGGHFALSHTELNLHIVAQSPNSERSSWSFSQSLLFSTYQIIQFHLKILPLCHSTPIPDSL